MTKRFLLDTNAYFLLYKEPRNKPYHDLVARIRDGHGDTLRFFLPAIAALEIYSVIGKAKRGGQKQVQKCERHDHPPDAGICSHYWWTPGVRGISDRLYVAMLKMVKDVHESRGSMQANIVPLSDEIIRISADLLRKYSDRFNFRSQDSLVAGTALYLIQEHKIDIVVATSDRVLKNVLVSENISVFDPAKS